jgi:Uma2 family endonuclease
MATDLAASTITSEQFAAMPNRRDYELVDGQLVERNVGNKASWVAFRLAILLDEFVRQHKLGWVFCGDTGFRLDPTKPNTVRKPDVAFVRSGRLEGEEPADAYDVLAPDLTVESISPNDTVRELEDKIEDYLASGVKLIWVIDPELRSIKVYRPGRPIMQLKKEDTLSGEDVISGFSCTVSDLFIRPVQ